MKKIFSLITLLVMLIALPALAQTKHLSIDGDHGKLAAVLQVPEKDDASKCPIVVICHGFMGSKDYLLLEDLANDLEAAGIASIRLTWRERGTFSGYDSSK